MVPTKYFIIIVALLVLAACTKKDAQSVPAPVTSTKPETDQKAEPAKDSAADAREKKSSQSDSAPSNPAPGSKKAGYVKPEPPAVIGIRSCLVEQVLLGSPIIICSEFDKFAGMTVDDDRALRETCLAQNLDETKATFGETPCPQSGVVATCENPTSGVRLRLSGMSCDQARVLCQGRGVGFIFRPILR